jgi:hypothetical protein
MQVAEKLDWKGLKIKKSFGNRKIIGSERVNTVCHEFPLRIKYLLHASPCHIDIQVINKSVKPRETAHLHRLPPILISVGS